MGKKFLVVFLLIFLIGCTKNFSKIYIDNGKKLIGINVEIADDYQKRSDGLMFRKMLDENQGMLFIFNNEEYQAFWMKNTLIGLDIIFINKSLEIVDIKHAVPCKLEPCTVYKSSKPAKYVLEVNIKFTDENDIKIGNKLVLNKE